MKPQTISFGSESATVHLVTGPVFMARCLLCGFQKEAGDGREMYADPNGAAFNAYFCGQCVADCAVRS